MCQIDTGDGQRLINNKKKKNSRRMIQQPEAN